MPGRRNGDEENHDDKDGNEDDKDNDEDGDTRRVAKENEIMIKLMIVLLIKKTNKRRR